MVGPGGLRGLEAAGPASAMILQVLLLGTWAKLRILAGCAGLCFVFEDGIRLILACLWPTPQARGPLEHFGGVVEGQAGDESSPWEKGAKLLRGRNSLFKKDQKPISFSKNGDSVFFAPPLA